MGRWFAILFILVPVVEMYLLLTVGGVIGAVPTIGLVVLTAVIGAALLKSQGLAVLQRAQERMARGEIPTQEMADGLMLAVSGPLLMTPGFVTDTAGFLLLTPPIRRVLAAAVADQLRKGTVVQMQRNDGFRSSPRPGAGTREPGDVIDGEFSRREDD
ncbi:MAG: FxsA family protein [Pseudomonadota bacterium]